MDESFSVEEYLGLEKLAMKTASTVYNSINLNPYSVLEEKIPDRILNKVRSGRKQ